jgi:hypothetical protein
MGAGGPFSQTEVRAKPMATVMNDPRAKDAIARLTKSTSSGA